MPLVFEPKDLLVYRDEEAAHTTLADSTMLGTAALQIERLVLGPRGRTSFPSAMDGERFAYVVRGVGTAHVGREPYPLEPESMLWLEPGDSWFLEADTEGIEVLICRAAADR